MAIASGPAGNAPLPADPFMPFQGAGIQGPGAPNDTSPYTTGATLNPWAQPINDPTIAGTPQALPTGTPKPPIEGYGLGTSTRLGAPSPMGVGGGVTMPRPAMPNGLGMFRRVRGGQGPGSAGITGAQNVGG